MLKAGPPRRAKEGEPEALAPLPVPERDEATLMARTQRAFEMQRYLRAGFSLLEAEEKWEAGEILPPTAASRRPAPKPPRGGATPKPQLKRSPLGIEWQLGCARGSRKRRSGANGLRR